MTFWLVSSLGAAEQLSHVNPNDWQYILSLILKEMDLQEYGTNVAEGSLCKSLEGRVRKIHDYVFPNKCNSASEAPAQTCWSTLEATIGSYFRKTCNLFKNTPVLWSSQAIFSKWLSFCNCLPFIYQLTFSIECICHWQEHLGPFWSLILHCPHVVLTIPLLMNTRSLRDNIHMFLKRFHCNGMQQWHVWALSALITLPILNRWGLHFPWATQLCLMHPSFSLTQLFTSHFTGMDDSIDAAASDFASIIGNHRIMLSVEQEHSCWVVPKVFKFHHCPVIPWPITMIIWVCSVAKYAQNQGLGAGILWSTGGYFHDQLKLLLYSSYVTSTKEWLGESGQLCSLLSIQTHTGCQGNRM